MAGMIVFNGTALESVAPVMIEDIRISPISLGVTARERPVRFGADFVRMTGGADAPASGNHGLGEDGGGGHTEASGPSGAIPELHLHGPSGAVRASVVGEQAPSGFQHGFRPILE
jgi:hypothetical protein